ncbi:GNAT family protein [Gordonia sp. VNK1]|uniref:GNAT family N-acetyltransferase n=1 Tax=Gordonia oleivorans TaxID=3156618 RepID=UPI0032B49EFE
MPMPSGVPVLHGGGVRLRPFADGDVPFVVAASHDSLIPLITSVRRSSSTEDAVDYIHRQHARLAAGVGYSFAAAAADTDVAVGQISLWTRDIARGRVSTGYWIAEAHRGRGFARAALATLSDWAFTFPEVARLELHVEPENAASWRTAESCGFDREGLLRCWQRVGSEDRDMFVYSRVAPRET